MGGLVDSVFGGSSSSGIMGTGQFRGSPMHIEQGPFRQKVYTQGYLSKQARDRQEKLDKIQLEQAQRLQTQASHIKGSEPKRLKEQAEALRSRRIDTGGPSIAEAQLRAATNRSLAQQLAAAKAARGGSVGTRERQLARSQAAARRDISEQAASMRLKEEQDRQRFAEEIRQADQAKALQAEQLALQALQRGQQTEQLAAQSLASQQETLQGRRLADTAQAAQDIAVLEGNRASRQALEELELKQHLALQGVNLSGFQSAAQQRAGLTSGIASGIMGMFGTSDKRLKKKIKKEGKSYSDENCKKNIKEEDFNDKDLEIEKPELESLEIEDKHLGEKLKGRFKKGLEAGLKTYKESNKKSRVGSTGVGERLLEQELAGLSDKECKKEIREEDFNPKSFLDALQAYSYEYKDHMKKDPKAGEGRRLGIMAQDLEKAGPVGRSMVKEGPEGKYVDYGQGFGAILAAQAHLNQRLSELEKKSKKKNKKS